MRCAAPGTAGRTRAAPGTTGTSCSASTGCRSSTSRLAPAAALGPAGGPDRYALVFNGEIYNYLELREELAAESGAEFRTKGDGEAIVAGYHHGGRRSPRLRGMFAFLIWDTRDRVLFGARDPFGIKPLFGPTDAGGPFSSRGEETARAAAVHCPGPTSTARPCSTTWSCSTCRSPRPWTPRSAGSSRASRSRASGRQVGRSALLPAGVRRSTAGLRARRRCTAVADVLATRWPSTCAPTSPSGAFLSGGIDSTAIAALAKGFNPDLITFTTGSSAGYSEVDVAAESPPPSSRTISIRTVQAKRRS